MNKIKTMTCTATSDLKVQIPDEKRLVVLYFYPKDATSGCTIEGQDFRDNHPAFVDANCVIYGVSRDNIKSHEKFKAEQNFPFELIADEDETLCRAFSVIQPKKLYGREYMGIVRSTFLIDTDGNILKHWSNVKISGHIAAVLAAVNAL